MGKKDEKFLSKQRGSFMEKDFLKKFLFRGVMFGFLFANLACSQSSAVESVKNYLPTSPSPATSHSVEVSSDKVKKILESAVEQTQKTKTYDPAYVVLPYPNGDVPLETGVCSDVIIRSFRNAGIDLQKEVHEDMRGNFAVYPRKWGLTAPDTNIDHRRVPNLQTFFKRRGKSLEITQIAANYKPGDVVAWDLNGRGLTHIGIVSNVRNEDNSRFLIIHNIGSGTKTEDVLFDWKIIGHYRYF